MKLALVLIFALSGRVAWAFDVDRLSVQLYCNSKGNCDPRVAQKFDFAKLSCESEVQALGCAELAASNPELAPLMRKCDTASLCKQEEEYLKQKDMACLRGYKNSLVDFGIAIKDMSLSLKDLVASSYEKIKSDNAARAVFLKACEKSVACKRDLVKDDHRYNQLSGEKLSSYSADFLYVESQDMKAYKSSLDRARLQPYVPISQRPKDDLEMPVASRMMLEQLAAAAKEKVKETYTKYSCYHPLAREEMECYAIGMVLDPTVVAGYFVKAGRAAMAVRALGKEQAGIRAGELAGVEARRAETAARDWLNEKHLSFSPTTRAENRAWMVEAAKLPSKGTVFLDVENSSMKKLNDTLKDKNLVTSLTNYHKEILFDRVKALEEEFPGLKILKYSDFKSSRFLFSGKIPKDLNARLEQIVNETNKEFTEFVKKEKLVRETDMPEEWFRAGVGNSADQANLAARYSRTQQTNTLQTYGSSDLQSTMTSKLKAVESDRVALQSELRSTSVVQDGTLHEDAFDIIRKNYGNTAQIKTEISQRFGLANISDSTVQRMQTYASRVDEFSPGIWTEARDFATLENANKGGLSADMIGLGAQNLRGTAEALAQGGGLQKTLVQTRAAEQKVTVAFKNQKQTFEDVTKRTLGDKVSTVCSGDDCIAVTTKALNKTEKTKLVSGLAETEYAGKYRLAFVNEGVKDGRTRTMLSTHGESVEKNLRKSLSAVMEPRKLKGLTFATDMATTELNRGPVDLIVGTAKNVTLTTSEKKLIQEQFRKALRDLNSDLAKSGQKGAYTPLQDGGW